MDDVYKQKAEASLNEAEARLNLLQAKIENIAADARVEYEQRLQSAKGDFQSLRQKVDKFKEQSMEGMEEAKNKLQQSLDKAESLLPSEQN